MHLECLLIYIKLKLLNIPIQIDEQEIEKEE